jgi:putative transposase
MRRCVRKRVARLMRAAGLVGCHRRRRARSTVPDPARVPDRLWFGDITYVATWEGWFYLAVLLDAHSRRISGWAMADHLRAELTLDALTMTLGSRRPAAGLIHHTDRGGQYTAVAYQGALAARDSTASMSRAGDCYDNALAESCFATLKTELVDTRTWPTRAAARQAIFAWIEVFSNRQRSRSALGYRSPVAFERELAQEMRAA